MGESGQAIRKSLLWIIETVSFPFYASVHKSFFFFNVSPNTFNSIKDTQNYQNSYSCVLQLKQTDLYYYCVTFTVSKVK